MTIASTLSRWEYDGDGTTDTFPYTNKIFVDADLNVYVDAVLQTLTTDYTVTGAGDDNGSVVFVTAPADGSDIIIVRSLTDDQQTDLPVGGAFPAESVEDMSDRRTIISQQQQEEIDRCLKIPVSDTSSASAYDAGNLEIENVAQGNADTSGVNRGQVNTLIAAAQLGTTSEAAIFEVASLTELQGVATSGFSGGELRYMTGRSTISDGGEGLFTWRTGDQSANVTADEVTGSGGNGGVWIAPTSDLTGASGAWERLDTHIINVKWYGAKGDGVTDDTAAIQAAIDPISDGVLHFPSGVYVTSSTLTIDTKNDTGKTSLLISAYGAKIDSSVSGANSVLRITHCKRLNIEGLEIQADNLPTYWVSVLGLWHSTWRDCNLGPIEFGGFPDGGFDSHYWNKFDNTRFGNLYIFTNTDADRHEFNQNVFISCNISSGDYAINKYGDHDIQDLTFIGCDISYYTTGVLYVDETTEGNIEFRGCYFDSAGGLPKDTKGIQVAITGNTTNPNDANVDSFLVSGNGSATEVRGNIGQRSGKRNPTSAFNFIKNGSMRAADEAGITTNLINTTTDVDGAEGFYSRYKRFYTTSDFAEVKFQSIAVPFDGWYTLTLIGRVTTGGFSNKSTINGGSDKFGTVALDTVDFTVASYTAYLSQGDVFAQVFTSVDATTTPATLEVAYAGLSYGAVGQLGLPDHPDADYYSPTTVEGGFTEYLHGSIRNTSVNMTFTPDTISQDVLLITCSGHNTFWVDVHFRDPTYPNGSLIQKLYISTRGSGNSVTNTAITQEDKARSSGDPAFTNYPTWAANISGGNVMLAATCSSSTSGAGALNMVVSGTYDSITAQL